MRSEANGCRTEAETIGGTSLSPAELSAFTKDPIKGASPAAWKAAGRRLAHAKNVSDGVVKDGGKM